MGSRLARSPLAVFVTVQSMGVDRTAHGWVSGGSFGGCDDNSAEAVGDLIAMTLATGLGTPPQHTRTH